MKAPVTVSASALAEGGTPNSDETQEDKQEGKGEEARTKKTEGERRGKPVGGEGNAAKEDHAAAAAQTAKATAAAHSQRNGGTVPLPAMPLHRSGRFKAGQTHTLDKKEYKGVPKTLRFHVPFLPPFPAQRRCAAVECAV